MKAPVVNRIKQSTVLRKLAANVRGICRRFSFCSPFSFDKDSAAAQSSNQDDIWRLYSGAFLPDEVYVLQFSHWSGFASPLRAICRGGVPRNSGDARFDAGRDS